MLSGMPPMLTAQRDSALKKVSEIAMWQICSRENRGPQRSGESLVAAPRVAEVNVGEPDRQALLRGERGRAAVADVLRLLLGEAVAARDVIANVAADDAVDGIRIAQPQCLGERRADARVVPDLVLEGEHCIERFRDKPQAAVADHVAGIGARRACACLTRHGFIPPETGRA